MAIITMADVARITFPNALHHLSQTASTKACPEGNVTAGRD